MKLTFIGSGSAFTLGTDNFHSNMLLELEDGNNLLIDCGSDARLSLNRIGYSHLDIRNVYISHLHADHVGGLEWLAFTRKFDPRSEHKPNLIICDELVEDIWNKTLSGGLSSLQGEMANLSSYFDLHPVPLNGTFTLSKTNFRIVQTVHIVNGFSFMHSYGLMFSINNVSVFITTDTQFAPNQLQDFYNMSDLIFHDCETAASPSRVHAHYNELKALPEKTKAKMWLYHYNPVTLPDAKKDGFRGFVTRGQVFEFNKKGTL